MRFSPIILLLFAMLSDESAAQTLKPPANAAEPVETQEQAIAAIKKLGGKVYLDEKRPNKPVIRVNFVRSTKVTDAGLMHLKGLTNLNTLFLGDTEITDITDEGVKKLQTALPNCKILP